MIKEGYMGKKFKLVNKEGVEVDPGLVITSFRGEEAILCHGGSAPHKPSSEGRIQVNKGTLKFNPEYYPSVFGLKWEECQDV